MRGQFKLFEDKFIQEAQKKEDQRPRNYYMPERNRCLVHRYYFHAEINKYRYDETIKLLEQEFFLTEITIVKILMKCHDQIDMIIEKKLGENDFKKMFPWLNWKSTRY